MVGYGVERSRAFLGQLQPERTRPSLAPDTREKVNMKKRKLRKNGYRFLDKILPFMNDTCPWCGKKLDIEGLKKYVQWMKMRKSMKIARVKRKNIDVDIDHKIPIWRGGTNDIENCQLMHPKCNAAKGGREPRDWDGVIVPLEEVISN